MRRVFLTFQFVAYAVVVALGIAAVVGSSWRQAVPPTPVGDRPDPPPPIRDDTVIRCGPVVARDAGSGMDADSPSVEVAPGTDAPASALGVDGRALPPRAPGRMRLAIVPLAVDGDVPPDAGRELADYLAAQVTSDRFDLVERSQLQGLMQERRLQESDPFDKRAVGRLADAQYLLVGSVSKLAGDAGLYQVAARIVEVGGDAAGRIGDHGVVTFRSFEEYPDRITDLAAQLHLRPPPATAAAAAAAAAWASPTRPFVELRDAINPGARFRVNVRPVVPKAVYRPGDRLAFDVWADRDCYVTLLIWGPDGNGPQRISNGKSADAPLPAGRHLTLPAATGPGSPSVGPPFGPCAVRVIGTLRPLALGPPATRPTDDPAFPRSPPTADALRDLPADAWATDRLTIVTTAGRPPTPRPVPSAPGPAVAVDPNQAVLDEWNRMTGGMAIDGGASTPVSLSDLGRYGTDEPPSPDADRTPAVDGGTANRSGDAGAAGLAVQPRPPGTVRAADLPNIRLARAEWWMHNRFSPGNDIGWAEVADRVAAIDPPPIGLVDSGICLDDERLRAVVRRDLDAGDIQGGIGGESGWNFVTNSGVLSSPLAPAAHGSVCASILAGQRTGRMDDVIGVCPTARIIMAVGVTSDVNGGAGEDEDVLVKCLQYCMRNGAKVINLSLGEPVSADRMATLAANPIWDELERRDVVLVCAAGNNYTDIDAYPVFPACLRRRNIVTVMAVDVAGRLARHRMPTGNWEPYSNYGRSSVQLAAPGTFIVGIPGPDMVSLETGTSCAAPLVAGTVALIEGQHPQWGYRRVVDALLTSVRPVPELRDCCASGGVLNVARALAQ